MLKLSNVQIKYLIPVTVLVCLIGFQNCSPSVDFSEQPQAALESSSTTSSPSPPSQQPIQQCGESGITQAKVVSPNTWNGQANNYIDFEVSLSSCDGKVITLTNQPILFDVNAFSPGNFSLNYQVNDGVSPLQSGTLSYSSGRDLFNNVGPSYGHWTTATLSFATSVKKVNIRIYLMGKSYFPNEPQYQGVTTVTQDYLIDTYLKFGNALPVTAKVLFKKP